jgi:chromosome segregation ATPase
MVELEGLRQRLAEQRELLEEARGAAESLAGERDRWQAEAERMKSDAAGAYESLGATQAQLARLSKALEAAERGDLVKREALLAEARKAAESLTGERDRWQAEAERMKADAAGAYESLGAAQARVARLSEVLEAAERQQAQPAAGTPGDGSVAEFAGLEASLDVCTERVAELTEERHALVTRAKQSEDVPTASDGALAQSRARVTELEDALEDAGQLNATLAADKDRLQAEVRRLRDELAATREALSRSGLRIERLTGERDALKAERDRAIQAAGEAGQALDEAQARTAEMAAFEQVAEWRTARDADQDRLRKSFEALRREMKAQRQASETKLASLAELTAAREALARSSAEAQRLAERERRQTEELNALRAQASKLKARLLETRARLAPEEGGDADLGAVRARAADLGSTYKLVYAETSGATPVEATAEPALDRVSRDLFDEQSLLARLVDASSVYTVRPLDSLSRIAQRVYGRYERWPDIYRANDHLIEDPDRLLPGMVLVIP